MSEQATGSTHPLLGCAQSIAAALDDAANFDPDWLPPAVKGQLLVELATQAERLAALKLRVLAGADDLAAESGARSAAAWLATQTRVRAGRLAWESDLGVALRDRHVMTGLAFADGRISIGHARAVTDSLDALPEDVGLRTRGEAEETLLGYCDRFTPPQIRRLGRRILHVLDPATADEEDRKALEAQERHALEDTTLSLTSLGDGRTRITGILPDLTAAILGTALEAYTNPHRNPTTGSGNDTTETTDTTDAATPGAAAGCGVDAEAEAWLDSTSTPPATATTTTDADRAPGAGPAPTGTGQGPRASTTPFQRLDAATGRRLSAAQLRGRALCALIEHLPTAGLPDHGGSPVTVMVTIDAEKLQQALGTATLGGGSLTLDSPGLSAGQARRLACHHGLLPAVLDGDSIPLDLGRTSRLFTHHQARAHALTHPTCQAEGCDIPAAWCERHHRTPWAAGGRTDLADLAFLCSHHHHRAHDPAYTPTWTRDTLTLHRRT